ncbi:MAG: transglycosylase SLT domain-containing protein [Sulfurimonas sp.]|uniref:lytic transglycosylase domain-containing protein n=1 Tax=Sulfurimonas sp. TaxID=2022749 RepID=UPI002603B4EF|nr:lytic transglycosylase domain-containing protein [Sulfurimonas sp.]MDD5400176.1 transglycosylase SLT domain-containing protein [Sulfurimonas sp.]
MKYILLLLLPFLLSANLIYSSNYAREVAILDSFDIDASFLNDPVMNQIKDSNVEIFKDERFFGAMDDAYIFIPVIKNILTKYNIPPEFLFLSMAESEFLTRAYSVKKASGLWQFMPPAAKQYGLRIDEFVDERRDLIKATEAAAKYLSNLYKKFGKWYLAAIAYNCGDGKLSKAIENAGSDELSVLLDPKMTYIPKESRLYIRRIVALAMMGNDEHFLLKSEYEYLLNRANAYSISTVKVPGGESLSRVSKLIGIPLEELKKLNRHLKFDFTPSYVSSYDIYIPYIKLSEFKQKYFEEKTKNVYKIHVAKKSDTVFKIAKAYGVPYKTVMDFNNLKSDKVNFEQRVVIPMNSKINAEKTNNNFYYSVKKGDTLESISKAYKISVENIKIQNKLKGKLVKEGERLKL